MIVFLRPDVIPLDFLNNPLAKGRPFRLKGMNRLPGTLSIHLDDTLSRQYGKPFNQDDSNIDEEDEDDDLYLYDEPPPYDIGAKLVEINAELANVQLPRESEDGRPRKVTFMENPVQSEIPPTPTDSTDEDDGYGDSTEASDDADGFCAQNPLGGGATLPNGALGGVDHLGPQPNRSQTRHNPMTSETVHDDLRLYPTSSAASATLEDDVSQLLMFAKQRHGVGKDSSATSQTNSLADELNQFLKSFTEMAIKNGAESIRDDVTDAEIPNRVNNRPVMISNDSEEHDDTMVRSESCNRDEIQKPETMESCNNLISAEPHDSDQRPPIAPPKISNDINQNDDNSDDYCGYNSQKELTENTNDIDTVRDTDPISASLSQRNHQWNSVPENTGTRSKNNLESQRLTLTTSAPRVSKMERNPMSNFLKWKRAFRLIHRKKRVPSQWDVTVDRLVKMNARSPIASSSSVDRSREATPETAGEREVRPQHSTESSSDSIPLCQSQTIVAASSSSATQHTTDILENANSSTTERATTTKMASKNKMTATLPLPAIGTRPPTTINDTDQETMIMTSQDGRFCMMTTEDFQSLDGESTARGNRDFLNRSTIVKEPGHSAASPKKGSGVVPRPLKPNKVSPGVGTSHQPLLKKSNSTLSSAAGCGKSIAGKPYSRGTFPAKAVCGARAQSASASASRRWDRSPDPKKNNFLPPEGPKNIFPPHGYGLSEEQKQERERKLKKIEMERQMKKQRELDETQKRKQEGEEAFQAWLRQKKKDISTHQYPKNEQEGDRQENSSNGKESGLAFQEWLKRKKAQQQEERRVEEFKEMVEEQMHYIRTREQNEKAFKKWLRRKRKRSGLLVGQM